MPSEHLETQMKFQEGKPLSADFATLLALLKSRGIVGPHDAPTTASELAVVIRMRPKPTARPEQASELPSRQAIHDSAHAAVFWSCQAGRIKRLRLRYEEGEVDEDDDEEAGTGEAGTGFGAEMDYVAAPGPDQARNIILMAAAGAIAEEMVFGFANHAAGAQDRQAIAEYGGLTPALRQTCFEIVEMLLPSIISLAHHLDSVESMTGPEVERFLARAEADEGGDDREEEEALHEYRDGDHDSDLPYTSR